MPQNDWPAVSLSGSRARAWDVKGVKGRSGAVDAFLDYPESRSAAFEVTRSASDQDALQLENLLGRDGFGWPLRQMVVGSLDLERSGSSPTTAVFEKVVLLCEAAGVTRPEHLGFRDNDNLDDDVIWLVEESSASLHGYPDVPAVDGNRAS